MSTITVLVTRPQREKHAEEALHRAGIKTYRYVERIRVRRERRREYEFKERSLHPRYVFAETINSEALGCAMAADHAAPKPSITGILGMTQDTSLASLRAIDGRELDPDGPQAMTKPKIGSLVTLRSGPFEGWGVRVTALHGNAFSATACGKYPLRLPYTHLHQG